MRGPHSAGGAGCPELSFLSPGRAGGAATWAVPLAPSLASHAARGGGSKAQKPEWNKPEQGKG